MKTSSLKNINIKYKQLSHSHKYTNIEKDNMSQYNDLLNLYEKQCLIHEISQSLTII